MQLPQERDGLQWDELRSFVGSAALYFDFAQFVDCTETLSKQIDRQTIASTPVSQVIDAVHAAESVPESQHPSSPTSWHVP